MSHSTGERDTAVIPRDGNMAPELRGPRVFGLLGGDPTQHVPDAAMDQLAARLADALADRM